MKLVIFSSAETAEEPRLFFKVACSAVAAGHEVVLIAQQSTPEVRDGIRIVPVPSPHGRLERIVCTTWQVFARALQARGDIYHFSDPELIPLGLLLQTLMRRPVIYDLREYHGERIRKKFWLPRLLRTPAAYAYEWVESVLLRRFAGVAAVNEDLAARLRARSCRVAVVPNYAPRSIFASVTSNDILERRYANMRVVIYVGGMSQDRGILHAVRAMAAVRESVAEARLVLVGRFHQPAFEDQVRRLIDDLKLSDSVEIVGTVPHIEVPGYLAVADVGLCLLQPTSKRYEQTEPIKYFEYAAAALPEVVSDLSALRKLIEKNKNGLLVEPANEAAIAHAIIRLLQDDRMAAEMGKNGQRAFREEYNWDTSFQRLQQLYEDAVDS